MTDPTTLARAFHEAYERLAPEHGYKTRVDSAVPWDEVPANNRALMTAVAAEILGTLEQPAPIPDDCRPWEHLRSSGLLWVRRTHRCQPPTHAPMGLRTSFPIGELGDAWRCHCGKLWINRMSFREPPLGSGWREANWWQRLRHRRRP